MLNIVWALNNLSFLLGNDENIEGKHENLINDFLHEAGSTVNLLILFIVKIENHYKYYCIAFVSDIY